MAAATATAKAKKKHGPRHLPKLLSDEETREVAAIFTMLDDQSQGWLAVTRLRAAIAFVAQRAKGPVGDAEREASPAAPPPPPRAHDPWLTQPTDPFKQFRRIIHNATAAAAASTSANVAPGSTLANRGGVPFEEFKTAMVPVVAAVRDALAGVGPPDNAALLSYFHEFAVLQVGPCLPVSIAPLVHSLDLTCVPLLVFVVFPSTGRRRWGGWIGGWPGGSSPRAPHTPRAAARRSPARLSPAQACPRAKARPPPPPPRPGLWWSRTPLPTTASEAQARRTWPSWTPPPPPPAATRRPRKASGPASSPAPGAASFL